MRVACRRLAVWPFVAVLLVAATTAPALPARGADACPGGIFGIRGQVLRIVPPNAPLTKVLANGKHTPIHENGVICAGESILVTQGGPVQSVLLHGTGKPVELKPGEHFTAPSGVAAYLAEALTFLSDQTGGNVLAPPLGDSAPTAARGGSDAAPALDIVAIRSLRDLPRQHLTKNAAPLVSWREGTGPYVCESMAQNGDRTVQLTVDARASWCQYPAGLREATQLLVRDTTGRRERWSIDRVDSELVPRPAWIPKATIPLSSADETAWAFWLWKSGGAEWRLQALAMLNALADREWVAGYLRDSILAEVPRTAPN